MICVDQLGKGTFVTVYLGYSRESGSKDVVAIKRNKCKLGSSGIFVVRETDLLKRFGDYKYVVTLKSIITGQLDIFVNRVLSTAAKAFRDNVFHFVLEKADGTLDKLI